MGAGPRRELREEYSVQKEQQSAKAQRHMLGLLEDEQGGWGTAKNDNNERQ